MSEPPVSEQLRVWLEPGFDRRVGAWLLDLPGAFAGGADEAEALSNAPLAAWIFADRMRAHGAFARALTDGAYNAYVSTVAVHPRQQRGVGRRVMRELMRGRDDIKWVLEARPGVERFYTRLGYESVALAMVHKRRR